MSDSENLDKYERRPEFTKRDSRADNKTSYQYRESQKNNEVNTIPNKPPIDHHGLMTNAQLEPQEEVVYEVVETPLFHVTRALFVGNLRKPINAIEFQKYLKTLASAAAKSGLEIKHSGCLIERAWLNKTRTHGIILVSNEEGAKFIRHELNNSKYPTVLDDKILAEEFKNREQERYEIELKHYEDELKLKRKQLEKSQENKASIKSKNDDVIIVDDENHDTIINDETMEIDIDNTYRDDGNESVPIDIEEPTPPKKFQPTRMELFVDYIPVKAINQWIFEEDKGPRNAKWKFIYETNEAKETIVKHILLQGDFTPKFNNFNRNRRINYHERSTRYNIHSVYSKPSSKLPSLPLSIPLPPPPFAPPSKRETPTRVMAPRGSTFHERDSYIPNKAMTGRSINNSRRTDSYTPNSSRMKSRNDDSNYKRSRSRSPGM